MCNNQTEYLQHRSHFYVRFEPGTCVVDDELAVVSIIPRFDASVQVVYSSVFVLPSDISVAFLFISEPRLNGCWSDDDLAIGITLCEISFLLFRSTDEKINLQPSKNKEM